MIDRLRKPTPTTAYSAKLSIPVHHIDGINALHAMAAILVARRQLAVSGGKYISLLRDAATGGGHLLRDIGLRDPLESLSRRVSVGRRDYP